MQRLFSKGNVFHGLPYPVIPAAVMHAAVVLSLLPTNLLPTSAIAAPAGSDSAEATTTSATTVYFAGSDTALRIREDVHGEKSRSNQVEVSRIDARGQRASLRTVASASLAGYRRAADPLAFLEGKVNCASVTREFIRRYSDLKNDPILQEEHRHVSDETCAGSKFSACSFPWCSGKSSVTVQLKDESSDREIAARDVPSKEISVSKSTAPISVKSAINTESVLTEVVLENGKSKPLPPVAVGEPTALAALSDSPRRFEDKLSEEKREADLAQEKLRMAKLAEDKIARAAKEEPAYTQPVSPTKAPGLVPVEDAQKKLDALIAERDKRSAARIALRRAEEEEGNLKWVVFSIPGATRAPRLASVSRVQRASHIGGSLSNHVVRDTGNGAGSSLQAGAPNSQKDKISARMREAIRVNDPTLSNAQESYFREMNKAKAEAARSKLVFPGVRK